MAKIRAYRFALTMAYAAGFASAAAGQRLPNVVPRGAETVSFEAERVLVSPSLSLRSFVLAGVDIPADSRQIAVRCSLRRERGGVAVCDVPGRQGNIEEAAAELAEHYRFRLDEAMQESASLLAIVIPERISADDVRVAMSDAPFVPFSQVRFERMASGEELGDLYPWQFGRSGLSPTVRLECEILPELTLLCVNPQVSELDGDDPALRAFQLAGLQASGFFRLSATLVDGQAAAGRRFRMTFRFQPPPYDR